MRVVRPLVALVVGSGLALGGAAAALAAEVDVSIEGFAFSPSRLEIQVGDTVTWTNGDAASHTATAQDGSWESGSIAGGGSRSVTFDTAGEWAYFCEVHPDMTGRVTVLAAGGAEPTPPGTFTERAAAGEVRPGSILGIAGVVLGLAGIAGALGFGLRLRTAPARVAEEPAED